MYYDTIKTSANFPNATRSANLCKNQCLRIEESFFFSKNKLASKYFFSLFLSYCFLEIFTAIWLRPRYNWYGESIASGEIDVMESRGNKDLTLNGKNIGTKQIGSTLHWGPDFQTNRYEKTHWEFNSDVPLTDTFHLYEFSWEPDSIEFHIDGKLIGSLKPITEGGFWHMGNFSDVYENPWRSGTKAAPFDQEFYLIINLAVGGIGYFPDNAENPGGKPWKNKSQKVCMLLSPLFNIFI